MGCYSVRLYDYEKYCIGTLYPHVQILHTSFIDYLYIAKKQREIF